MGGAALAGEAIFFLIAFPFVALADWFKFIKRQPPGQQELTKACHGAGMLALLALWFSFAGGFSAYVTQLGRDAANPVIWIAAGIAAWGLGWLLLNAGFAARAIPPPHRATMIVRGLLKAALGAAAWIYAGKLPPLARADLFVGLLGLGLYVLAAWCTSTGGTKVLLMLWRGSRREAYPLVARDIAANEFDWDR
jgi:hypothetical protein